jgi:signal transduction histidine kinase
VATRELDSESVEVMIKIKDNGIGITEEDQIHLFKP